MNNDFSIIGSEPAVLGGRPVFAERVPIVRPVLPEFASLADEYRSPHVIMDLRELAHQPSESTLEWQEDVIIRIYNKAGVRKLACVWGSDVVVPEDPERGANENFVTRYFADTEKARDWLLDY